MSYRDTVPPRPPLPSRLGFSDAWLRSSRWTPGRQPLCSESDPTDHSPTHLPTYLPACQLLRRKKLIIFYFLVHVTGIDVHCCSFCSLPYASSQGTLLQLPVPVPQRASAFSYWVRSLNSYRSHLASYPLMGKPRSGTTPPS